VRDVVAVQCDAAVIDAGQSGDRAQQRTLAAPARAEQAGDLAYFYGPYSVSSKQGVVEKGMYLEIWRRHDGRWLIELDVNS